MSTIDGDTKIVRLLNTIVLLSILMTIVFDFAKQVSILYTACMEQLSIDTMQKSSFFNK